LNVSFRWASGSRGQQQGTGCKRLMCAMRGGGKERKGSPHKPTFGRLGTLRICQSGYYLWATWKKEKKRRDSTPLAVVMSAQSRRYCIPEGGGGRGKNLPVGFLEIVNRRVLTGRTRTERRKEKEGGTFRRSLFKFSTESA